MPRTMASNKYMSVLIRFLVAMFFTISLGILQQSEQWLPRPGFKPPPKHKSFQATSRLSLTKEFSPENDTSSNSSSQSIAFTSNVYSSADIINPKTSYQVNETIQIRIIARDIHNVVKTCGGDYFRVKLYTAETQSSWSIDVTKDLGNGTYIANVTLRWPGKVAVIVTLVHPSEAVRVLQRIRVVEPGKSIFTGRYSRTSDSGVNVFEDVMCLPKVIQNQPLCNFTDGRTGYPWFCVAPSNKNLSCDDWKLYTSDHKLCEKYTMEAISKEEQQIFKVHKLPIVNHPLPVNVIGDFNSWRKSVFAYQDSLPSCRPGQHLHNPSPSGFYSKNIWFSDQCKLRRFTKTDVLQCLQNRAVHIFGDSTSKQLYLEFANRYKPDIVGNSPKDKSERKAGPLYAKSAKFNISIHFKFHGFPARPSSFIRKETINYIVNELDDLKVDSRSVILICVGTHYTTYPLEMYEERMRDIKAAVQRLRKRSPQTLVVFKSANTREHAKLLYQLHNSEWYIRTLDLALREVLKDSPELAFIDAWDMTIAQNFKDNVHPNAVTITNLMNNFLSYICHEAPKPQ
ncbi:NXPE family member 3-like [Strongylocentrotus purpuratus]|uniref:NXPE C-terminal domain-containing protein n=1 Tax=Strongylocentrotus purpuratus TaxID=7668 RepID=A0A7M7SV00_STRPU|nr:NXPE family member 3-like [Strongylocentrotus purpuratus]